MPQQNWDPTRKHGENTDNSEIEKQKETSNGINRNRELLNDGQEDGSAHGAKNEEGGEAHVVLEEISEVVIVKKDKEESDDGN